MFNRGERRPVDEYYLRRQSPGTTVTVVDFMHNLPVRKKMVNHALDMEHVRAVVAAVAVANPAVSFTVRDDAKGDKILQTNRSDSAHRVFQVLNLLSSFLLYFQMV